MAKVRLSIIIVTWNSAETLRVCLESLFKACSDFSSEIIVVDNASSDDSVGIISSEYPQIRLICNEKNDGFAKANNKAMKVTVGEYILLLNPDTIIKDPKVLGEWVKYMDYNPSVGASGCRLVFPNGKHQVGDAGFKPTLFSVLNHAFFISYLSSNFMKGIFLSRSKSSMKPIDVDWISGAAFLVRRSILDSSGYMDENTFMYAEDVEWGCRIRSSGFKIRHLPYLEIVHLQGASAKNRGDEGYPSFMWLDNMRLLYAKYNKNRTLAIYDFVMSSGFLLRVMLYSMMYWVTNDLDKKHKSRKMAAYFNHAIRYAGKLKAMRSRDVG